MKLIQHIVCAQMRLRKVKLDIKKKKKVEKDSPSPEKCEKYAVLEMFKN